MWVIGHLSVTLAWGFCKTAVGDPDAIATVIKAGLEPYTLTEGIYNALVDIPSEHVHQIFHPLSLTAWHMTDAITGKSLICASASRFVANLAAFFFVPPNAGPIPVIKR
jgi:hypothetical protein